MCEVCNYIQRSIKLNKMSVTQIFNEFDQLVQNGKLEDLGLIDPGSPIRTVRYRCIECGETWRFTLPDHAFEGELVKE